MESVPVVLLEINSATRWKMYIAHHYENKPFQIYWKFYHQKKKKKKK